MPELRDSLSKRADQRASKTSKALAILAVAASAFAYVFIVSAGKLDHPDNWHTFMAYYDLLAEAFRAGQLHLIPQPHPLLVAQPNPYDWSVSPLWAWDMTLHNGRFYLYWGPVPAVLLAVVKELFGIEHPIGDQVLTTAFMLSRLFVGASFIWLLLARCFPAAPSWLAGFSILVFGLGAPVPHFVARGAVYEASIAGGQFFLVLGLLCVFLCVDGAKRRLPLLFAAGVSWGLAIGCRVSLSLAIAILALGVIAALFYRERSVRGALYESLMLGQPLLAALLLFGLYNKGRFGSFTDFGLDKQLAFFKFGFEWHHILPNIYSYLFRKLDVLCGFPFVRLNWHGIGAFPPWFTLPVGHQVDEPTMGLLWGAPWVLLAPWGIAAVARRSLRERLFETEELRRLAVWTVLTLSVLATVPLFAALGLWTATTRYEIDIIAGLTWLASLGAAVLVAISQGAARRALVALMLLLGTYSVVVGLLLGFSGYFDLFEVANVELFRKLQMFRPFCP